MATPQPQPGITPGFHMAVRGSRCHTSSHWGRFPLSPRPLGGLQEQPLVTSLSAHSQPASSAIPSVKVISGGTAVDSILSEFPDLTHPTGVHTTCSNMKKTPNFLRVYLFSYDSLINSDCFPLDLCLVGAQFEFQLGHQPRYFVVFLSFSRQMIG
jgi:hypothetical protein